MKSPPIPSGPMHGSRAGVPPDEPTCDASKLAWAKIVFRGACLWYPNLWTPLVPQELFTMKPEVRHTEGTQLNSHVTTHEMRVVLGESRKHIALSKPTL